MVASWIVRKRQETLGGSAGRIRRPLVVLVGFGLVCGAASSARAECGVGGGDFSGQCVDLTLVASVSTAQIGEIFEVEFLAKSANAIEQPVQAVEGVIFWDPSLFKLLGAEFDCQEGSTADPCYSCSQTVEGGLTGYNWVQAGFPNDVGLDGLNADCGPDTFCSSYTGAPFNDGTLFFQAIKQVFCNGVQAPPAMAPVLDPLKGSLLITRFTFEALAPGTAQISLEWNAPCSARQMYCLRGDADKLGDLCATDADCGTRACIGGVNDGVPCSSAGECPVGVCLPLCSACTPDFCCTSDDNCDDCAFAQSRVLGGVGSVSNVVRLLVPTAPISICPTPSVSVDSSRYLNVVPPAGTDPVAIQVMGVSQNVSCLSKYVQSNGQLGAGPIYKTPAQWQSSMTDLGNDPADPTVHVRSDDLIAGETYSARLDCNPSSPGTSVSAAVEGTLWMFGDVDNNRTVDITDILRILSGFSGNFHALTCISDAECSAIAPHFYCDGGACLLITFENVEIHGVVTCGPDRDIGISDALTSIRAFQSVPDDCAIPCP